MKLFHRLVIDKDYRDQFLGIGIDLLHIGNPDKNWMPFVVLTLAETDDRWLPVSSLIERLDVGHTVETEFARTELHGATCLHFCSKSTTGYPEPSSDGGYLAITYDLSDYCDQCGTGKTQKQPFRMKSEVKWGRRQTTQLNWVEEELFVRPDIWESVFKPMGIDFRPVQSVGGRELDSVVQLKVEEEVDLNIPSTHVAEVCSKCGRVKFQHNFNGYWPSAVSSPVAIAKSVQYFGWGHAAHRALLISHDMFERMDANKLNCQYWACSN